MNKKEFLVIGAVILVLVIMVVVVVGGNDEKPDNGGQQEGQQVVQDANEAVDTEFVSTQEDGTDVNISDKLKETKTVDGLTVAGIVLTERDNLSEITATVTNNTDSTKGDHEVAIKIVDKSNNEIITVNGYIEKVEPGESVQLNVSATADFVNAYDFSITKK